MCLDPLQRQGSLADSPLGTSAPSFGVTDYLTGRYEVPGAPVNLDGAVFLSVVSPDSILACGAAGNFPLILGRLERCLSGTDWKDLGTPSGSLTRRYWSGLGCWWTGPGLPCP